MGNTQAVSDFEECLSKLMAIVCGIHAYKTKKGMLQGPLAIFVFFYPMASGGKITIGVRSLPRVTGEINLAGRVFALIINEMVDLRAFCICNDLH
jgi:hypothetical protein